jgi:hypothetical protein
LILALALVPVAGCSLAPLDLSGYRCEADGACAAGFECNVLMDECVPILVRSCAEGGTGVCWSSVDSSTACETEGTFIPCGPVADCSKGCRTCNGKTWGECEGGETCVLGTLTDCTACGDTCADVLNASPSCDNSGDGPVCTYEGDCTTGHSDADLDTSNGCECDLSGGTEICDGADNDCNGLVDDVADVNADCNAQYPGSGVATWT